MKKFWNKAVSRSVTRVLTLMGIGTTSLLFMACYGTPPSGYKLIDEGDTVAIVEEDSMAMTIASPDEEVVAEIPDSLKSE